MDVARLVRRFLFRLDGRVRMVGTTEILGTVAHRPWPLPRVPWLMFQSWRNLLFAHGPISVSERRPLVPPELTIEKFDGSAWVALTPCRLTDLRPRWFPTQPKVSSFLETNFRTYVRFGDKPGIFFFTLEAASRLAVAAARLPYRLPYHHAEMRYDAQDDWVSYRSRRDGGGELEVSYRALDEREFAATPGTLEHFLIERYALYAVLPGGRVLRGDVHHLPWSLRAAEADISRNTIARDYGMKLPPQPFLLHFAGRQDTLVWPPHLV